MLKTLMIVAYLIGHPTGAAPHVAAFNIISPAFANATTIPTLYTCHGRNISMPLKWSGLPRGTKSLALLIIDQDVPRSTWYHWAVYNIPPDTAGFKQAIQFPENIKVAANSWGNRKYQGPCPPNGEHRYIIKLYALDTVLPNFNNITTVQLREAMRNHVLDTAHIMARSAAS